MEVHRMPPPPPPPPPFFSDKSLPYLIDSQTFHYDRAPQEHVYCNTHDVVLCDFILAQIGALGRPVCLHLSPRYIMFMYYMCICSSFYAHVCDDLEGNE